MVPAVRRLLAVVPLVLVAACGTESTPAAENTTTTTAAPTTTTTTVTTTTTTAAAFTAADGRNLQACADGTCEVFVTTGDALPNASGAGPVQVTVQAGEVSLAQTSAGGMASTLSGAPGNSQQINNQVFEIVAVQDGQAVLRLSLV